MPVRTIPSARLDRGESRVLVVSVGVLAIIWLIVRRRIRSSRRKFEEGGKRSGPGETDADFDWLTRHGED